MSSIKKNKNSNNGNFSIINSTKNAVITYEIDSPNCLDNWLKSVQKFSNEENHNIKKNFISTKNHIEITNDFEQANFRQLVNYFKSPEVFPALIIIPDSRYFAKNLIELVEKIIQIA